MHSAQNILCHMWLGMHSRILSLLVPEMDPARFYGTAKHVNIIPGDGDVSDDEIDSDCDENCATKSIRLPPKRHII